MFCTDCGAVNRDEAKFCRACGKPFLAALSPAASPPLPDPLPKASFWRLSVSTLTEARTVIRQSAHAFYLVAALQTALALLLGADGSDTLVSACLYVGFAMWLHIGRSRVAALCLLALSVLAVFFTTLNQMNAGTGGRNIVLSLIVTWISVKAVYAAFAHHRLQRPTTEVTAI